jgi:hypothetical protein
MTTKEPTFSVLLFYCHIMAHRPISLLQRNIPNISYYNNIYYYLRSKLEGTSCFSKRNCIIL